MFVWNIFVLPSSQYFITEMVIFLLIPLFKVKSSNRMGKACQMGSMGENRSARMKVFGGENRMGVRAMYLSNTGKEIGGRFCWIWR